MKPLPTTWNQKVMALGLMTAGSLLFEVTLTRLLSVALWYPLAFVALGTALLGFSLGAALHSMSFKLRSIQTEIFLRRAALGFGFSVTVGYPLWNRLPADPLSLGESLKDLFLTPVLFAFLALPFVLTGLFVARVFAEFPQKSPYLYAIDLGGAALGVLAYVLILPSLGGPGSLLVAGSFGFLAALILAPQSLLGRLAYAFLVAAVLALAFQIEQIVPLRITSNKLLGTIEAQQLPRSSIWTLSSTIDVIAADKNSDPVIVIDGGTAMSQIPRHKPGPNIAPSGLRGLPYALTGGKNTLVIGSGGGVEVQAALAAGAKRILALEIDPAINKLMRGKLSQLTDDLFSKPEVELVTAEARAFLETHPEKFDVIVAFHTISNAASQSGALSLAENYLLTVEALKLLLSRLNPNGILLISRPESQLGRLAATAALAWKAESSLLPLSPLPLNAAVITQTSVQPDFLAALLISAQPLTAEDFQTIKTFTPGRVAYLPDGSGDSQEFFTQALSWPTPLTKTTLPQNKLPYVPASLKPTFDDRPFFNLPKAWLKLSSNDIKAVFKSGKAARARLEDLPVGQVAVLILIIEALLLGCLVVFLPARAIYKNGLHLGRALPVGVYFSALGLAFMAVEVVLILALSRIVGTPALTLILVLSTLLIASGLGSLVFAGRFRLHPSLGCLMALLACMWMWLLLETISDMAAGLNAPLRLAIAGAETACLGVCLGVPFACGLRRLKDPKIIAWAWALNGLFSVLGSITALIIGSALGLSAVAALAAGVYGLAALAGRKFKSK